MLNPDPLRINYIVVQGDDQLDDMSPFQGFGSSWPSTLWALRFLTIAPASFLERRFPLDGLLAQRMGGMHRLAWMPLWVGALEQLSLGDIGFATVVMTGDPAVAERVEIWIAQQPKPVLHITDGEIGDDTEAIAYCDNQLRDYCRTLLDQHGGELSEPRLKAAQIGVDGWKKRERIAAEAPGGHNITCPNELVLLRADRTLAPAEPFVGQSEAEYDALAVASAQSVLDLRDSTGLRNFNRMWLPRPGLILTEPAFYRPSYGRVRPNSEFTTKPMMEALRRLQTQRGLWNQIAPAEAQAFLEDPKAQMVVRSRQEELTAHTYGVGLMAAQTVSAVLRLRPAVNHVFPTLSRFARNVRATSNGARFKTPRLFDDLQRELAEAVGEARIKFIEGYQGEIKIVSDAPLELLPIAGIPLGLRFETSRINATPGNLMMGELVGRQGSVTLDPTTLRRVLVVSAFSDDDPLRNLMERSLEFGAADLAGRVETKFVRVKTRPQLVDALNGSDATILVFDGHGSVGEEDGIGGVMVDREKVNIWELRGEARIPPIVILSACDTHGIDAPTHATVGNGFIAGGAITVLATMLPIGGISGAVFVSRLLLRLGYFLPAALGQRHRVYSWCEIMTGMLRMVLGTDLVDGMVKDFSLANELKTRANSHINSGNPEWYQAILDDIVSRTSTDAMVVSARARRIMSRSEAIRYIQLGAPESILIDDGGIYEQFFEPGIEKVLGIE